MTEDNKRTNIATELERAKQSLDSARLLRENGLLNDAVSRLYYFSLHMLRALLLAKGVEPKSHEGVLRMFSLHFVREGIFETKDAHIFSRLMKYREEADYNPAYSFTEEDFSELERDSMALSGKINAYLKSHGLLADRLS